MDVLSNIESVCYDDDQSATCDKLKKEQEAVRKDTEDMQIKVDSSLEEYLKI